VMIVGSNLEGNYGACQGPHCKFYAPRCEGTSVMPIHLCRECCDRLHTYSDSPPHKHPTIAMGYNVRQRYAPEASRYPTTVAYDETPAEPVLGACVEDTEIVAADPSDNSRNQGSWW
jgi:hypothetical protein